MSSAQYFAEIQMKPWTDFVYNLQGSEGDILLHMH